MDLIFYAVVFVAVELASVAIVALEFRLSRPKNSAAGSSADEPAEPAAATIR